MKKENRKNSSRKTHETRTIVMVKGSFNTVYQSMYCCDVGAPTVRS